MTAWTVAQIPDQTGRVIVVTGASSGIGADAAAVLAGRGARVVLAVRNQAKGDAVGASILSRYPGADVTVALLDLANLASVRDFSARMLAAYDHIDVLLNNAGLGMQATRATTADGYERQFGTNHLGHFALTGRLMPALLRAPEPRVVSIASLAHRGGRINFDDLQGGLRYSGSKAYNQSKLANLLFAFELDRRARAAGSKLVSVAAHPGIAATGFVAAIGMQAYKVAIGNAAIRLFGQDAAQGAQPGLYAATMPDVRGGQYWGPDGFLEIRGRPALAKTAPAALNAAVAKKLWAVSEALTGVTYPALA